MATYDDWRSIAHIAPILDDKLQQLNLKGRIVIVDDSSNDTDGKELLLTHGFVAIEDIDVVHLGSNQGNQRALAIGTAYIAANIECDYLVVMDSDNEDKPDDVPALLQACKKNNNDKVIFAERSKRSEGQAFRLFYFLYKWLYRLLTGDSISVGNFSVIPGKLVRRVAHISELWNHFPISIIRSGVHYAKIPTERGARLFGQGKMNMVRLIIHAFSGFTIHADIVGVRMMLFAGMMGLGIFFLVVGIVTIKLGTDMTLLGWTSQIIVQLLTLFALISCTALIILTTVLSLRMQLPSTPFHEHARFIYKIEKLYSGAKKVASPKT